jgi:hypothetical protein
MSWSNTPSAVAGCGLARRKALQKIARRARFIGML